MIPTQFYPSAWSDPNVNAAPTGLVQDIPITTPDFTQAYWLGWVAWDNVPMQYHVSRHSLADGVVEFKDITVPNNYPIGYSVGDSGTFYEVLTRATVLANNGEKWQAVTNTQNIADASNNARLPNSADVNTVLWLYITIGFVIRSHGSIGAAYHSYSLSEFINDAERSFNLGGTQYTFKISDFNEYDIKTVTVGGQDYEIVMSTYRMVYGRDNTISGGTYGYQGLKPMLEVATDDGKKYVESLMYPINFVGDNTLDTGSYRSGGGFTITANGDVSSTYRSSNVYGDIDDTFGGYVGKFKLSDMPLGDFNLYHPEGATFYLRGNGSFTSCIAVRIFTYDEIYKTISFTPRTGESAGTSPAYANGGSFYYAKIDLDTNEFLADFVRGDKTDELADWQKIGNNINTDIFNADDIPIYEPPEPPDMDEDTGATITRPGSLMVGDTFGFFTQYALTAANVQAIGSALWAETGSADFISNLLSAFFETSSIDISAILDYFIALRVYPFPLINLATYVQHNNNKIFIGRGVKSLDLGNTPNIGHVSAYCAYIDGGTVDIPRYYNDFRDYAYTTVTAYLPYIGSVDLPVADVMGATLSLQYAVDFATGCCTAYVDVMRGGIGYPVYIGSGKIGAEVPLSASNAARLVASAVEHISARVLSMMGAASNITIGAAGGKSATDFAGAASAYGANPISTAAINAADIAGQNPILPAHSGSGSGFDSFGSPQTAYVQIRRGITKNPPGRASAYGNAVAITAQLGTLSGFTQCVNPDVSGITADADIQDQIRAALISGVYL